MDHSAISSNESLQKTSFIQNSLMVDKEQQVDSVLNSVWKQVVFMGYVTPFPTKIKLQRCRQVKETILTPNIITTTTIVLFGFANIVLLIHLSVCNI